MDILALAHAGRHEEAVQALKPRSDLGDAMASNNISIVYRIAGQHQLEIYYALLAFQQDPQSPAIVNTVFRALNSAGQSRLITTVYNSLPTLRGLSRDQHLIAAVSFIAINRTDLAMAALARIPDFPRDEAGDLSVKCTLAAALSQHEDTLALLDEQRRFGVEVERSRITQLFALGDMPATVAAFENPRSAREDVGPMAKTAMLAAIAMGDHARAERLSSGLPDSLQRFARHCVSGTTEVEVQGRSRTYRFPFDPTNISIAMTHCAGNFYEAGALFMIAKLLSPGDLVLDVGANIGNHSVYFAGEVGCEVIAFECNPNLVPQLRMSIQSAGLADQVDLTHLGAAVSDTVGAAHFNFIRSDYSNVSASRGEQTTEVPSITLDSLNLPACRLIKIDVDGGEPAVLRGAENLLRSHRPIVAIESMNYNIGAVLEFFAKLGYEILREDSRPQTHSDFIFAPAEMDLPPLY